MVSKKIIRKYILEQLQPEDEWVEIDADYYEDMLKHIDGDGELIRKFPEYRGKKIKIVGNLNLSRNHDVKNIDSIDLIDGDLDISNTNIKFFDKNKITGYFSYWGSAMDIIEKQKKLQEKLDILNELREDDAWNVENNTRISNETEALYEHLYQNSIPREYEDENGELKLEDKYFIWKEKYDYYGSGSYFTWFGLKNLESEWVVIPDSDIDDVVKQKVKSDFEEMGTDAFANWVIEDSLDENRIESFLYDFYSQDVYDSPESWSIEKQLSDEQLKYISAFNKKIELLNDKLKNKELSKEEIEQIEDDINDFEQLIEDEKEDPKGEYSEDDIEREIQNIVDDRKDDFIRFIDEIGFEKDFILDFIDLDKVANTIIRHDGYGVYLNHYDGDDDEYEVNGEWYHVMRYN